jgi:hypothetical protein
LNSITDLHPPPEETAVNDDNDNNDDDDDDGFLNRVVDKTFPALIQAEIFAALRTSSAAAAAAYHDAVWRCGSGAAYRAHRLVLAMGSPFLR